MEHPVYLHRITNSFRLIRCELPSVRRYGFFHFNLCLFNRAQRRRQQAVSSEEVLAGDCEVHEIGAIRAAHVGGAVARVCQPLRGAIPGINFVQGDPSG